MPNYILDIIDVFSKWMWSYPLINRNSQEILIELRKYLLCFGMCKKIQTDKAYEYCSSIINNFCIEDNIERVLPPPHHLQANGSVEAAHKISEKYDNYFYTFTKKRIFIGNSKFRCFRIS